MANKPVAQMGLPPSVARVFVARAILTAKDALSLPELDLMALLDLPLPTVRAAVACISEIACPPYQTAFSLMEERHRRWLATGLVGLDDALCSGIPSGKLTEIVGPSGIGKTQFCMKLALLAAFPECYGGLNGRVIYIDTESKFSSRRMIEIGESSFPQVFNQEGLAQKMARRIIVLRPSTLSELNQSLEGMKVSVLQHEVKLLIVDSMAALVSMENERSVFGPKQHPLRWTLSFLKSIAELSRIPIVVTNQVRSQHTEGSSLYRFQSHLETAGDETERLESHLVAALGIQWAHSVTIRLVFEALSDRRFIKVAKSPASPAVAFPFVIESSGIRLLSNEGISVPGPQIMAIRNEGLNVLMG